MSAILPDLPSPRDLMPKPRDPYALLRIIGTVAQTLFAIVVYFIIAASDPWWFALPVAILAWFMIGYPGEPWLRGINRIRRR